MFFNMLFNIDILRNIHRKTSVLKPLFNKVATLFQPRPKRGFNAGVFLQILQNFYEQRFL